MKNGALPFNFSIDLLSVLDFYQQWGSGNFVILLKRRRFYQSLNVQQAYSFSHFHSRDRTGKYKKGGSVWLNLEGLQSCCVKILLGFFMQLEI